MSLVENRYAEALINIAAEKASIDEFLQDLGSFAHMYSSEPGFKDFLLNPQNETGVKKNVVFTVYNGRVKPEIINFVSLLLDKGRIKYLPGIYEEFIKLADQKRSILTINILSAVPLGGEQISVIANKYQKLYNAVSVKTQVKYDPGLIGGIRVVVGDKMTDASVKGRLRELEQLLLK